ncbi:unnamed protein product [Symbiodinium sp. CCMP2592]|nr:unnamed protein product [Symbiodinium sp. CCMP2592]
MKMSSIRARIQKGFAGLCSKTSNTGSPHRPFLSIRPEPTSAWEDVVASHSQLPVRKAEHEQPLCMQATKDLSRDQLGNSQGDTWSDIDVQLPGRFSEEEDSQNCAPRVRVRCLQDEEFEAVRIRAMRLLASDSASSA